MVKKVCIVGFMGSGKTTAGNLLSSKLNVSWVDTDDVIVLREGKSIASIFADDQEEYFRIVEKKVIKELIISDKEVISLGGGGFTDDQIISEANDKFITIWLKADLDILIKRLHKDNIERPILHRLKCEKFFQWRSNRYSKAHYHIDTSNLSISELVAKLVKIVS